jgi:hypothetical protein
MDRDFPLIKLIRKNCLLTAAGGSAAACTAEKLSAFCIFSPSVRNRQFFFKKISATEDCLIFDLLQNRRKGLESHCVQ